MPDVMTPEQRSRCMAHIRGRDTGPEIRLRQALWKAGMRYRVRSRLTGRPDIIFPKPRIAVFVDGCFWHGCPQHAVRPASNRAFWDRKLERNRARDAAINDLLTQDGWRVVRIWEHEVDDSLAACVQRVQVELAMAQHGGGAIDGKGGALRRHPSKWPCRL